MASSLLKYLEKEFLTPEDTHEDNGDCAPVLYAPVHYQPIEFQGSTEEKEEKYVHDLLQKKLRALLFEEQFSSKGI